MSSDTTTPTGERRLALCRLIVALWVPLFLWSCLPTDVAGITAAGGLQRLMLLAFVIIHASLYAGWRGAGVFLLLAYAVSFALEALSIHTGVPFGWFVHFAPGPKPLGVPLLVPLAYGLLAWLAWALATLLCRRHPADPKGSAAWLIPLVGALILTGYDLAYDAIGSAVKGMWAYRTPSGFFGVPISNFIGWIINGTMIFAIFAGIERHFLRYRSTVVGQQAYWTLPCIVWGTSVLQYVLFYLNAPAGAVVVGGRRFLIADIYEAALIVALFSLLLPALAALARALQLPSDRTHRFPV